MNDGGSSSVGFRKRSRTVLLILLIWGLLVAVHTVWYSWCKRDKLLAESTAIAWREGEIPPVRGRLLTSDFRVLAHTVLSHDLFLENSARGNAILPELKKRLSGLVKENENGKFLLKKSLLPSEITAIQDILRRTPELSVVPRMERICTEKRLAERIGHVSPPTDRSPLARGLDGWESEHDRELSGRPGSFRVMLDRNGNWVSGTLEVRTPPEHGKDVRLQWSWKELTEQ